MVKKTVTIFGSSRVRESDAEYTQALAVGRLLAGAGFVICNGGYSGTMEAAARGAKEAGGATIGVTVELFPRQPNRWIDKEIRTGSLFERLSRLMELGDGYVVLKGGTGTLLELAAVWEFINKGMMREKPIVLLGEFWSSVVETLREELLCEGFGDCTKFVRRAQTPEECVRYLKEQLLEL